jgi:hypothetical protein
MGRDEKNSYSILVGKLEGKRQLWRPRGRWGNNAQKDVKEQGVTVWPTIRWLRTGIGWVLL